MPGDYDIEYCSPWAGANYFPYVHLETESQHLAKIYSRFGKGGTSAAEWEKATWPVLKEITENHPEAGIHFLDALVYNRKKDQSANLFASELARKDPWFKDVVPNVRPPHYSPTSHLITPSSSKKSRPTSSPLK